MTCSPFDSNPAVAHVVMVAGITVTVVVGGTVVDIEGISGRTINTYWCFAT